MLREAVQSALTGIDDRYRGSSTHASVPVGSIDSLREALAATAPPLPWTSRQSSVTTRNTLCLNDVPYTFGDLSEAQQSAVLDALNALAEKENAPVADRVAAKARLDEAMSDLRRSTPEAR